MTWDTIERRKNDDRTNPKVFLHLHRLLSKAKITPKKLYAISSVQRVVLCQHQEVGLTARRSTAIARTKPRHQPQCPPFDKALGLPLVPRQEHVFQKKGTDTPKAAAQPPVLAWFRS
jgi:hypothetical protein